MKIAQIAPLFESVPPRFYGGTERVVSYLTEELVKQYVSTIGIKWPDEIVELNEETLEFIASKYDDDRTKILNLTRLINEKREAEGEQQPHLIAIGDRADEITSRLRDRQIDTKEALRELQELAHNAVQGSEERESLGLDSTTYGLLVALREREIPGPEKLAHLLEAEFLRFPNFRYNEKEARLLKAALYKTLLPVVGKDRMVDLAEHLIKLPRKIGGTA